jgi:hypothetical protein
MHSTDYYVNRALTNFRHPEYFPTKAHEKIFALMELDGTFRSDLLGLTYSHVVEKDRCRQRMQELRSCIAESGHPFSEKALERLARIERSMLS